MRNLPLSLLALFLFVFAPQSPVDAQISPTLSDGFHDQLSAILEAYRSGNKAAGEQLIEGFRLSHPDEWFTEHLGPDRSSTLTERYNKLFPLFAADLERTILDSLENKFNLVIVLKEGTEEPPSMLLPSMKLSGIKTTMQTALFYSTFDRRSGGISTGSWARAFTYQSGAFRFIGYGSLPFWIWEKDTIVGSPKRPLQMATLIQSVPPVYPASAQALRTEGKVSLMLRIDTEGKVKDARVMSGDPSLTQAAIDAVRQWRFKPPIQNGSSVESDYVADVVFELH